MFFECVHPEDIEVLLNQVLPDFANIVAEAAPEDKKNIQFQHNYRFKRKSGEFVNLLEQTYVLEIDDQGRGSAVLSNVILLNNTEQLPIRWSAKILRNNSISETIFLKTHNVAEPKVKGITTRELDILRNLASGKTSKEIGNELFISRHTVDTHRRNLLSKLECRSVVELAQFAFKNGLL